MLPGGGRRLKRWGPGRGVELPRGLGWCCRRAAAPRRRVGEESGEGGGDPPRELSSGDAENAATYGKNIVISRWKGAGLRIKEKDHRFGGTRHSICMPTGANRKSRSGEPRSVPAGRRDRRGIGSFTRISLPSLCCRRAMAGRHRSPQRVPFCRRCRKVLRVLPVALEKNAFPLLIFGRAANRVPMICHRLRRAPERRLPKPVVEGS